MKLLKIFLFITSFTIIQANLATDPVKLRSLCCSCRSYGLNCPFCELTSTHGCSLTDNALNTWAASVLSIFSTFQIPSPYFSTDFVTKSTSTITYLPADVSTNAGIKVNGWRYPCTGIKKTINQFYGLYPTNTCDQFANQCFTNACCYDLNSFEIDNPNSEFKYFCSYSRWRCTGTYYLDSGSSTNLCNTETSTSLVCPALVDFLANYPNQPADVNTVVESKNDIKVYYSDQSFLPHLIPYLYAGKQIHPYTSASFKVYSFCSNATDITKYIQKSGYWSNFFIRNRPTPCDVYVPYDSTKDICIYDLYADIGAIECQDTFRAKQNTFQAGIVTFPIPLNDETPPVENVDCSCYDHIVSLLPNTTSDYQSFAQLQSDLAAERNRLLLEQSNQYAEDRQKASHSWWEYFIGGLFTNSSFTGIRDFIFECIEHFFEVLLSVVGDFIINVLNSFYELLKQSQPFIDMLVDYITKILDVLFSIIALIIKVALGLLLQAEEHFLIFEYTLLFLFVNYKFLNNNIFCLIVVIVAAIVFGIERQSPSILLLLYSPQYSYVNFSYYQTAQFTYKYPLTVHNRIEGTYKQFNVSFPKLSEIPIYNTTIKGSATEWPIYNTTVKNITCDSFPIYNTTN